MSDPSMCYGSGYSERYSVAAFLETALETKQESRRLEHRAIQLACRIRTLPLMGADSVCQEMRDILCRELMWVLADLQSCEDRYASVESLIDLCPDACGRAVIRGRYLDHIAAYMMPLYVYEKTGVDYSERNLARILDESIKVLQEIYDAEVLCE